MILALLLSLGVAALLRLIGHMAEDSLAYDYEVSQLYQLNERLAVKHFEQSVIIQYLHQQNQEMKETMKRRGTGDRRIF